jgi:hypothetical protein
LLVRKERWGLSWRGGVVLAAGFGLAVLGWLFGIYPFLAVTERVDSRYLAVEGWVHGYAMRAAAEEFRTGGYDRVFTTGGPVEGVGSYINDYSTAASIGAGLLRQAGVAPELIQMVPSRETTRDRTFSSAVALRRWTCTPGARGCFFKQRWGKR